MKPQEPEYTGVRVGVEVKLGEAILSPFTTTLILLEEVKKRHPKEFSVAIKALAELED